MTELETVNLIRKRKIFERYAERVRPLVSLKAQSWIRVMGQVFEKTSMDEIPKDKLQLITRDAIPSDLQGSEDDLISDFIVRRVLGKISEAAIINFSDERLLPIDTLCTIKTIIERMEISRGDIPIVDPRQVKQKLDKLPSGITWLDTTLDGGFIPGELVLVVGATEIGKTQFIMNILLGVREKHQCVFVCLDDSPEEVFDRLKTMTTDLTTNLTFIDATKEGPYALKQIEAFITAGTQFLFMDYIDLLTLPPAGENKDHVRLKQLYKEARQLAQRQKVVMVTPTQATLVKGIRSHIDIENISDSKMGKLAPATLAFGLTRPSSEDLLYVKFLKKRRRNRERVFVLRQEGDKLTPTITSSFGL